MTESVQNAVDQNPDHNVERAAALDTASLSDALDRLGIVGQCRLVLPLDPSFRMTGRAFTVLYGPAATPPGSVGDYIDEVPAGSVIVLDNGGRTDATVWGNILTEVARQRGIAGTIIDGVCRDVVQSLELGYPVYSRGRWMRTGKDRVQVEGVSVSVNIGDVRVRPGDLIRGDADGVVVIPREHEARVLAAAEEIELAERAICDAIHRGEPLAEARKRFHYHQLQKKS